MSGLFDIDWNGSVPLNQIASIELAGREKGEQRAYRLMLKDNDTPQTISEFVYQHLIARPLQLVPSQPGIYALSTCFEDEVGEVEKTPVIAWARCFDGSIRIVTPAGVDDGHMWKEGQGYVLMPDGTVQSVGEYLDVTRFDTVDAYLAYQTAEHNRRQDDRT